MNFKRAIAREWLLFLLVFILSPAIVAIYHWIVTPRTSEDFSYENPRVYGVLILSPGSGAQYRVDPSLPKLEREQAILKFIAEHSIKEFTYTLDLVNPQTGKSYEIKSRSKLMPAELESIKKDLAPDCTKGDWFDKVGCERKGRIVGGTVPQWDLPDFTPDTPQAGLPQIGQFIEGDYLGDDNRKLLQGIQANGFLSLKKRSLVGYVFAVVTSPSQYYAFIVIYPLFLFVRSVIWSIRKIKEC